MEDKIEALDQGADDYVIKPFDLRELHARVRALIRRKTPDLTGIIEFGDLIVDKAGFSVSIAGKPAALTRREFSLLEVLLSNRERVVPKETIFERMFSFDEDDVNLNAVELYVGRLRRKLTDSNVAIKTLRGLGYQLVNNG